ncbi:MAG: hypothetical protein QME28_01480 [Candidatus Saccharicenans sp.]|nr:hypothetical protein [Candidatus Saccharicenans sp.]
MIECLLPEKLCSLRKKIRWTMTESSNRKNSEAFSLRWQTPDSPAVQTVSELLGEFVSDSAASKLFKLIWLVEELAACRPTAALRLTVETGLINPALKEERSGASPVKLSPVRSDDPGLDLRFNHLFLAPPLSLSLRMLRRLAQNPVDRVLFPVFSCGPADKFLVPLGVEFSASGEIRSLAYFLFQGKDEHLQDNGKEMEIFPFRPLMIRPVELDSGRGPVFVVEFAEFRKRLITYFILLSACFSGWTRAGLQRLISKKSGLAGISRADAEICYLATEVGRLQFALFHLSRKRKLQTEVETRKVEKICLKGLHLASRAWRFHTSRD